MLAVTVRLRVLVITGLVCAYSTSGDTGAAQFQTRVTLNVSVLTLHIGQTLQLKVTAPVMPREGLVTWSSRDDAVAGVSPRGVVSARTTGNTTVTAMVQGGSASATISVVTQGAPTFSLSRELLGTPRTLSAWTQDLNVASRQLTINGVDTGRPNGPFIFAWGDGNVTVGYFPQKHTYGDASRNYVARVTASYSSNETDSVDNVIRFVAPQILRMPYPPELTVEIPTVAPALGTRLYRPPLVLLPFDDSYFGAALPRRDVEYVLTQAAAIEFALVAGDVEDVNGEFRQIVLRDPSFSGAYSLWYTNPIAFAAAGSFLQGTPQYSSLFHEMGHNLSLNAPEAFRYGGRIDGPANAIFSETVAQMYQQTVAFELVNNAARYGLPDDLAAEIAASARSVARGTRASYEAHLVRGMPFATWNDPQTPADETSGTVTLLWQFLVHAEQAGSYVLPLSRAMRLLGTFNQEMLNQYAPRTDSADASTFRATLMVAALSYGFQEDLRAEFRALNVPIDDQTFVKLLNSLP